MYTQILSQNPCTLGNVHKAKCFCIFPHRFPNNLTIVLPYPLRELWIDPPFPIWSAIYWAFWIHWRVAGDWEQGNYSPLWPHLLCLSLHPFVPLEHTELLFPRLSLRDGGLKWWSPRWRTQFLRFEEVSAEVVTIVSLFLLIEISISCPIHMRKYEYCIHGCFIFLYMIDYIW